MEPMWPTGLWLQILQLDCDSEKPQQCVYCPSPPCRGEWPQAWKRQMFMLGGNRNRGSKEIGVKSTRAGELCDQESWFLSRALSRGSQAGLEVSEVCVRLATGLVMWSPRVNVASSACQGHRLWELAFQDQVWVPKIRGHLTEKRWLQQVLASYFFNWIELEGSKPGRHTGTCHGLWGWT